MADPYLGEIRMFGGNFAPQGWMFCAGQTLSISENDALFTLVGTTFGGDGVTTFGLPDLRGRIPIHQGGGIVAGEIGGTETVTLSPAQLPAHTHPLLASGSTANNPNPGNNVPGESSVISMYQSGAASAAMAAGATSSVGGNQPHDNMQPFLCINFIISLAGIYPSQG